jgi:hypothetical protein
MFWELSNDDGRLLEALRAGLGRAGPAMDQLDPAGASR